MSCGPCTFSCPWSSFELTRDLSIAEPNSRVLLLRSSLTTNFSADSAPAALDLLFPLIDPALVLLLLLLLRLGIKTAGFQKTSI